MCLDARLVFAYHFTVCITRRDLVLLEGCPINPYVSCESVCVLREPLIEGVSVFFVGEHSENGFPIGGSICPYCSYEVLSVPMTAIS